MAENKGSVEVQVAIEGNKTTVKGVGKHPDVVLVTAGHAQAALGTRRRLLDRGDEHRPALIIVRAGGVDPGRPHPLIESVYNRQK